MILPRYPIYIPSKNRADSALTMKCLRADGVPFTLVIGEENYDEYKAEWAEHLMILPWKERERNQLMRVRNFIWEDAIAKGFKRHWQLDDNISHFARRFKGSYRIRCKAGIALAFMEDFTERYTNVGISGPNYVMFVPPRKVFKPFFINTHIYSCMLMLNSMPIRFRYGYNHDVDMCLQILAAGMCTISFNAFLQNKIATQLIKGGNTDNYLKEDFRIHNVRALQSRWPGAVELTRRFSRAHFKIKKEWKNFDNQLIRDPAIDWDNINADKYKMKLIAVGEVRSDELKELLKNENKNNG